MPFPVSISFSANSLPFRTSSTMPLSSTPSTHPRPNPPLPVPVKRPRPRGLWKARGSASRASNAIAPPPPLTPAVNAGSARFGFSSDDDRVSCSSSILANCHLRGHSDSVTPLSTDLDDTPHARPLVTKQQHQPQDYFSTFPQPEADSSDDDSSNWTTRTRVMDVSTIGGPGDSALPPAFTYEDWLDLKQLFTKACEQYDTEPPAETMSLFRGVIHECHRCLLSYNDPSQLFSSPHALAIHANFLNIVSTSGPLTQKMRGAQTAPVEPQTAFHSLLGTTLFMFGCLMGGNPELALPGEPPNPVPYWIAALDVFEGGDSIPGRIHGQDISSFRSEDRSPPPRREDWNMAIMWGRTLVAIADEMNDRNRGKPPPPPKPEYFPSPFPTNSDYLKTGTIWDDEPEWPVDSPFGVITSRWPSITRRMILEDATPHEMLKVAMDHFSRGIFHLPHNTVPSTSTYPLSSRQPVMPQFTRAKVLYEVADAVLLLADKLENPDERREWSTYGDSILGQIHVSLSYKHAGNLLVTPTTLSRDTKEGQSVIGEGLVAKARGQAWLTIGSTLAESIEEKMDQDSEMESGISPLMGSEDAQEAREALTRAVEFFERARTFVDHEASIVEVKAEEQEEEEEEDEEEEEEEDDMMVDEDEDADDENESMASTSAGVRARGKQRQSSKTEETPRVNRLSKSELRKLQLQAAEREKEQLSELLAEALCSLANLTEDQDKQEEYYRRAEEATGRKLFDCDTDHEMSEEDI